MTNVLTLISGAGASGLDMGGHAHMRRPALHRPRPAAPHAAGWSHPYAVGPFGAVFYNDGGPTPTPAPPAAPAPPVVEPPKPGPPPSAPKTFTQDEVNDLAAKEKAQGKRAALKDFAEKHGFSSVEDAETFIAAARQAQQDAMSEQERREQELAERERKAEEREKAAIARERTATRRAALAGLGATGEDLEDAYALLRRHVADDADEATVQAGAEALKARQPGLFGGTPAAANQAAPAMPPAPGMAPAGGPPPRQAPTGKPGDRGREMARLRGHLRQAS